MRLKVSEEKMTKNFSTLIKYYAGDLKPFGMPSRFIHKENHTLAHHSKSTKNQRQGDILKNSPRKRHCYWWRYTELMKEAEGAKRDTGNITD